MQLLASELSSKNQTVVNMARELGLSPTWFQDAVGLDRQMGGPARRIVLLTKGDMSAGMVAVICRAAEQTPFGLVVCVDREALRLKDQDHLMDELAEVRNVQWLPPKFSSQQLGDAVRECRKKLLRISEDDLRSAIKNNEFSLRYQPKVVRSDGHEWRTAEAEALLRWQHPKHGRVGPLEFLPELEAFDLMGEVSEFVLREAAAQLVKWREEGLELNSCINLASSQLNNPDLPELYESIVSELGLRCSSFTFEVIEQDIADSEAPHLKVLNELRARGFRISLDDFGIAAATLGTLEALPVDEIKIHAAALKRARQSDVAQKVLAAVTGLAHNLGISVCAEGVEDQETYEFLELIECDKLQGYLISEAVMPELIQSGYNADSVEVDAVA